jgi:LPXTG-motif cell wall-anchored protein
MINAGVPTNSLNAGQNRYLSTNGGSSHDITGDYNTLTGYVDVTAVPEPTTFILGGGALAAGAIGAYFKRRRKANQETTN